MEMREIKEKKEIYKQFSPNSLPQKSHARTNLKPPV